MVIEEGDTCSKCGQGLMHFKPVENCSCHLHAPCSACVDNRLACDNCGWEDLEPAHEPVASAPGAVDPWQEWRVEQAAIRERGFTFPHGGRVFNVSHDGRSGSTHVVSGCYEGPVTADDIISHFGSGTFGHRQPSLWPDRSFLTGPDLIHGRFSYTKITD